MLRSPPVVPAPPELSVDCVDIVISNDLAGVRVVGTASPLILPVGTVSVPNTARLQEETTSLLYYRAAL